MLSIEGLSFRYPRGDADVLNDVALAIPAGGIFGLLGPNGAGKTTLISIIAGQLRVDAGRVAFAGEPLDALRRRRPHCLGLVPQEHAFYPMLTCAENLRFFAGAQGLAGARLRERVAAVAAFARIEDVLGRRAGQLSGGLKRRLNLAVGLLTEPDIVLLDEPTVGVDPQSRAFLLDSIRSLAGPGRVIVYTSHYMEEVQAICDRIAIIDRGRVLLSGALDDVLRDASNLLTLRLRAPLPQWLASEWTARYALADDGEARYRLRLPDASAIAGTIESARAAGCEPLAVAYGERDLEQLFMQLTHRSLRD
ncbi:MAG TPA: ABC transporter ATP-binding protein [Burkholderiales bacterium]|nr:ABC transporter ATP-binding protein [Burkholderiales bacterium]